MSNLEELCKGKLPVVVRRDYVMFLEWFQGAHWFHTDVFKWTPEVKTNFLEDLNVLSHLIGLPLYALVQKENQKLNKFGKVLGWSKMKTVKLTNNQQANIYKWSK